MKVFSFNLQSGSSQNIPKKTDLLVRFILLLFAAVFLFLVIVEGVEKVSGLFSPYLIPSAHILIGLYFLGIYPLSLIHKARPFLVVPSYLISSFLGACAWLYALLFVMNSLGFWGMLLCFLFNTLTPITLFAAVLRSAWDVVGNLALWLLLTMSMKFYTNSLKSSSVKQKKESRIIDIESQTKD